MSELISQVQYADRHGWSHQYVNKLVQQGRITLVDGKIDPEQADRQIKETADEAHPKNRDPDRESTKIYKEARFKNLLYDTKIKKLQCEIQEGKWVRRAIVEKIAFEKGRIMRDKILQLGERYQYGFSRRRQRKDAVRRLLNELHEILSDFKSSSIGALDAEAMELANKEATRNEH